MARPITKNQLFDLWLSDYGRRGQCCLCGNAGVIDTRGSVFTAAGVECGDAVTCICPNGQSIKRQAGAHPKQPNDTPSNENTSGLAEIISDDEILRVHGHANFGSDMTPRDVVNEGVLKYAFGYCSGHTQLCILMEHGLITKPRPGSYDASLTKKGKRYARALGGYQNAVTAASAQAEINSLAEAVRRAEINEAIWSDLADEHKARADRLAASLIEALPYVESCEYDNGYKPGAVLRVVKNIRAALQQETQP